MNDIHLFMLINCTGPKKFSYKGHNYFYSGQIPELANKRVDWLEARNICREYCMDAVSIETQEENNLVYKLIQENDVPYIWTSGRLCDFSGNDLCIEKTYEINNSIICLGCEGRKDLLPKNLNGWFWSANREKIQPTNRIPVGWVSDIRIIIIRNQNNLNFFSTGI